MLRVSLGLDDRAGRDPIKRAAARIGAGLALGRVAGSLALAILDENIRRVTAIRVVRVGVLCIEDSCGS
jgi:hypothetical protein